MILVEVGVESPGQIYNLLVNAEIYVCPQKSLFLKLCSSYRSSKDGLELVPDNGTILLALELNPRLQKARSQVTIEPLSKKELAFCSSERDLSPNINNARYVQVKL